MKKICTLLFILMPALIFSQTDFRSKTLTVRRFLEQQHYKPVQWNDTSSLMLYNKWMKELDEEKIFFTQKEMAVLETYKTKLDDELLGKTAIAAGKDFFSQSTALYKLRLLKTDSIIKALTAKPFDFSKPDNIVWPFAAFAGSEQDVAQRWLRYLKWRVLNQVAEKVADSTGAADTKLPANFAKLESDAREKIKQRELAYISNLLATPTGFINGLEDGYLNAIAWCYDPHTSYMSLKAKKEFDTELSGTEYSTGLDLEEDDKGDKTISYLQPGGSAWRSGQLHKGDVIVSIKADGKEKNVTDMPEEELGSYLNGNSESDVEITVRTSAGETKKAVLHKEKVDAEESIVKSYVLHGQQNIGYINLPGFYSREDETTKENEIKDDGCANDVSKEIVKLKKDTIAGLILDLRFNGGGSMWEAMQLAGIFIDIGPVASVKDKEGKVHFLKDPNRGTIYDGPLIVLVNGASASASEFVSAALQDYNRALIVGGSTYGKGTAQEVLPLDTIKMDPSKKYEDYVKVTLEKFYRVNGSTTQWKGVIPDIGLPDLYADDEYKEKSNASALQPDNSKQGIYQQLPALPVATLTAKSKQRTDASEYFKMINNFSGWMQQFKKERNISLQWSGYAAQYNQITRTYKQFAQEEKSNSNLVITNNGFDWQRILQSTQRSREINEVYLQHLQNDQTLAEAYRILMDWNGK